MKGISTVIATILMLMITIALAGTAYLYISGSFTTQTQGLEVIDAFCNNRVNATIVFRNIGTTNITINDNQVYLCGAGDTGLSPCGSVTVTRTTSGAAAMKLSSYNSTVSALGSLVVEPGTTFTLVDGEDDVGGNTGCTTINNPRSCIYRITPPSGRSIVATVSCSG